MNEQLNLTEILKNHIGESFYLTIAGTVVLKEIVDKDYIEHPIIIKSSGNNKSFCITKEGRWLTDYEDAECILFPSKTERDWKKWDKEHNTRNESLLGTTKMPK